MSSKQSLPNGSGGPLLAESLPVGPSDQALAEVRDALRGLRFGVVSIIVQDGVVVQIERTEKRRLKRPRADD